MNANMDLPGSGADRVQLRKHLHLRRQRAARACTHCHSRKVRCDLTAHGSPCTNCKRDLVVCTVLEGRRGIWKKHTAEVIHLGQKSQDAKDASSSHSPKTSSTSPRFLANAVPGACELDASPSAAVPCQSIATLDQPRDRVSDQARAECADLIATAKQLLQKAQALAESRQQHLVALRDEPWQSNGRMEQDALCGDDETMSPDVTYHSYSKVSSTPNESMIWRNDIELFPIDIFDWKEGEWAKSTWHTDSNPESDWAVQDGLLASEDYWTHLQNDEWPCFPG